MEYKAIKKKVIIEVIEKAAEVRFASVKVDKDTILHGIVHSIGEEATNIPPVGTYVIFSAYGYEEIYSDGGKKFAIVDDDLVYGKR